jgi:hypothetical protein
MKRGKLFIKSLLFFAVFFVFASGFLKPLKVEALMVIDVNDKPGVLGTLTQTAKDVAAWAKEWAQQEYEWLRDQGIALAYKKALGYFLNKLAYDTATYLATGEKGQGAMFYTESWKDYLKNTADNAAGVFLEELGAGGPVKFNLCDPGLDVTMRIGFGLMNVKAPEGPDCTFSEMKKNWEQELRNPNFMARFANMFEPASNDFGIALSLQTKMMEIELAEKETSILNRQMNDGIKDVTDKVSETIKTPGAIIRDYVDSSIKGSKESYLVYTGNILADAVDVFTNTLASKLMKEWLKKGISRTSENTAYTGNWGGFTSSAGGSSGSINYGGSGGLTAYEADTRSGAGIAGAKEQFKSIIQPTFSVGGDYDALSELAMCGNPVNSRTNECVITEQARQAIENRMTVGAAIRDGYLQKDGVFGFRADGLEPNYNEGWPYRSLIILRKNRIIPVGWELAAQYIKDNQDSLRRSLSLSDMVNCFADDDVFVGYSETWCRGLVDPKWVLKAPQNFCKREGPGPNIISSQVMGTKDESKLIVTRSDYCADEQTCIREGADGACEIYGYCTEDRRKYNFNGSACDPIYNTCESFRSKDGRTIAFLENTLDYGSAEYACSPENAGCRLFKQAINPLKGGDGEYYDASEDKIDWENLTSQIRLDDTAGTCDKESEGCHEFIRTKAGLGANLLTNPSFEEFDASGFLGWPGIGTESLVSDSREGSVAVLLTTDFTREISISPYDILNSSQPFDLDGIMFTLSLYARNCNDGAKILLGDSSVSLFAGDEWRLVSVTHSFTQNSGNEIIIQTEGISSCTLDAVKLERTTPDANGAPTRYTDYRQAGLIYQKLIPAYLFASCYDYDVDENGVSDGFIERRSDAPSVCDDYARYCTAAEVNCELYTSISDNFTVPAVVDAEDYCPSACVGYDEYTQSKTNFEILATEYFIPKTAKTCTALAAGCDEFTNLDELDSPEAREYYIHLRQCVDSLTPTCEPFFMWEGSDETGYQLKVHRLDTVGGEVKIINPSLTCSTDITSLDYNADCREFYDADGTVDSQIYYNTVSCTDECHPYRRTVMDDSAVEEANCNSSGGRWQTDHCIYMGVPSEGVMCAAEEAGCREYNGNAGANTRIIFEHSFESGTNQGWTGGTNSNESVIAGERSLKIETQASFVLGGELIENRSYLLQFLAKGGDINSIVLGNDSATTIFEDSGITGSSEWRSYRVNMPFLNHTIDIINESLIISVAGTVYLDNIRLTEVTDRHYLIKDSWVDNCDYENADPALDYLGESFYAGCDAYLDRDKKIHNLYKFNHLCSDDAVGCELMIDTHNLTSPNSYTLFDTNNNGICDPAEADCISVPADSYIYAVYDKDKTCAQKDKGCERLGLEYFYEYPNYPEYYQYFDNYKLNNPDLYGESLCRSSEVGCDSWQSANGTSNFKDPGDMICEWRVAGDQGMGRWDWLRKKVKRCDTDTDGVIEIGAIASVNDELRLCSAPSDCDIYSSSGSGAADICSTDTDCSGSAVCVDNECRQACIMDNADYACAKDNDGVYPPKTAGLGGYGNKVSQPLGNLENKKWVGVCPAGQDGCTEYIDPQSIFSFDVDVLKPYTLYIGADFFPVCSDSTYYVLDLSSNLFVAMAPKSGNIFYYAGEAECRFNADNYSIRQAVVSYQLEKTLDKTTCNGMVDLESGCMLFNERSRAGADGLADLKYNSNINLYKVPDAPNAVSTPFDTNVLLKVEPDRTCETWLACRSFIKDEGGNDVCYDVGLCERLDDNGNCSYFSDTNAPLNNQTYDVGSNLNISNLTGYSKVGYGANNSLKADYYPIGQMRQSSLLANVPNGSFELYDANMYPIGWTPVRERGNSIWERDKFRVINNPVSAQLENIKYPLDGKSFLKFGAKDGVRSEPLTLVNRETYYLTYYINTKNLAKGTARMRIGSVINETQRGVDWRIEFVRFTAGNSLDTRIEFDSVGGDGNIFIDKLEIKPVLNSRNNWQTTQSCRLYPESNALSCDYYDDSGHRKVGWPGYCLEYDRYPGNTEACLLWYPIDKVNGDGVERGGGYIDRKPLYYCVDDASYNYNVSYVPNYTGDRNEEEIFVENNNFGAQSSGDIDIIHRNPIGTSSDVWTLSQLGLGDVEDKWLDWKNIHHIRIRHTSPSAYCDGKLSDAWDYYYRFNQAALGYGCPESPPAETDCTPWGTPHVGGVKNTNTWVNELSDVLDPGDIFGFGSKDIKWDKHTVPGGIEILTQDGKFSGIRTSNFDSYCNHPDYHIVEVVIFPNVHYCNQIIQTVTPMGQNQYYSANVYEGSDKTFDCLSGPSLKPTNPATQCDYMSDLAPFGAVSQPGLEIEDWAIMSNPFMWDSREGVDGNQPLYYEIADSSMFNDSQARMGQLWTQNNILSNLFAKSYGLWEWKGSQINGNYESIGGAEARVGSAPRIEDVKLIPENGNIYVNQLVNLRFNTDVAENQLPLISYTVRWGDDTVTSVSGIEMRDRPSGTTPHSLYHIYSRPGQPTITIEVKDNWQAPGSYILPAITVQE